MVFVSLKKKKKRSNKSAQVESVSLAGTDVTCDGGLGMSLSHLCLLPRWNAKKTNARAKKRERKREDREREKKNEKREREYF